MTTPALRIKNLNVHYDKIPALTQLSLEVPMNSRTAIVGPNGAGKSSLFKSMLGLQSHQVAHLEILGQDQDLAKVIQNSVAYIPQATTVNWQFPARVYDVVMMGRYAHITNWLKRPSQKDRDIVHACLDKMQLLDVQERHIRQLSGGQRQRVFIARALAQEAQLYLMDEPLAGIDQQTEDIIMATLKDFQAQGKTSLVIHHDLDSLTRYFDHIVWLNQAVIASGPLPQLLTPELYAQTYQANQPQYQHQIGDS